MSIEWMLKEEARQRDLISWGFCPDCNGPRPRLVKFDTRNNPPLWAHYRCGCGYHTEFGSVIPDKRGNNEA